MSEEEKKLKYRHWVGASDFDLEYAAENAMAKVFQGKDPGVDLCVYTVSSGYERGDGALDPVILLHTKEAAYVSMDEPEASVCDFTLPEMSDKEKEESSKAIQQVLDAFGLEGDGEIGWKFLVTVSCHPR